MPAGDVLERLGRGIKPSVGKKEMYEITKRGVNKLPELLKKEEACDKKAEAMARREKVKMLDQVNF